LIVFSATWRCSMSPTRRSSAARPCRSFFARRAGMLDLVDVGGRTKISRATMKRLLLKGLGRVDFYYASSKPKDVQESA
jgi:hypothetical protein